MTRSDMRDMLSRQLQDLDNAAWSVANKNTYLNLGLQFMQSAVLAVDPEAYIEISTTNLIATGDWPDLYPKPQGLIRIFKVELDYNGDGTYTVAKKLRNDEIVSLRAGNTTQAADGWAQFGRWIKIWPSPTVAATNGLRLTFVPSLTMGADADVPDLPTYLHKGIVYAARLDALGDTDEDVDPAVLDAVSKKLAVILDRIPLYFGQDQSEPEQIEIDIDHESGWG